MKYKKYAGLLIIILMLSYQVFAQTDTLEAGKLKVSGAYLGSGFGAVKSGLSGVISGTFLLSNNWGLSLRYNPNLFDAKNIPDDYVDIFLGFLFLTNGIPMDYINIFSIYAVKEFPTKTKLVRLGFEFGPSFIKNKEAIFTPVDNYIPLLGSNYDVTYDIDNCVGFSIRGKAEFPLTRFLGFETAPYLVINRLRNVLGIDFILTLGLLR